MWGRIGREQYHEVLDHVVEKALRAGKVHQPPVDPFRIAKALKVQVLWDIHLAERGRYLRLRQGGSAPQATMILQHHPRPERRYWAAAHELGEHLVYQVAAQLGLELEPQEDSSWREQMANHLAARILLPTVWFAEDGRRLDWDLRGLKARYCTASHEAIARRMLDMPTAVLVSLFDQGRLSWRRANRWGRPPPVSREESFCWQAAHQQGHDQEHRTEGLRIRAWAVHEPGWRREILRTEIPDEMAD